MKHKWLIAAAGVLAVLLYVGLSARDGGPGLPLDDGWIHQTYARNLARTGRWEYTPGAVSAGSTAPLWTLLLAAGYGLRLPHLGWAFFWGWLCLVWLAWSGMALWRQLWPALADKDWLPGLALVLTWPLVWAAASGMETTLFIALGLAALAIYSRLAAQVGDPDHRALALSGFLCGLLVLVRPDGLALAALVALGLVLRPLPIPQRAKMLALWLGTAVLPLIPYFAFNLSASERIWPNTLYAKQAEYAAQLARPFLLRLVRLLVVSLGGPETGWRGISGAHLLLLPGLVIAAWLALKADWRARRLISALPLLWAGGHVVLYAWRLPLAYQHGRYLLAAVPIWVLYGLAGWQVLFGRWIGNGRLALLARRASGLTFAILLLFFLLLGGLAYATDVAFIEGEMVATARWLASHTNPDDLIAAHDIGALGYFAERPLLDLAGLITPEIVPLLADEAALAHYILASNADYLVTAPGWPYSLVTESAAATQVYATGFAWTQAQGENNTAVYRLNTPLLASAISWYTAHHPDR